MDRRRLAAELLALGGFVGILNPPHYGQPRRCPAPFGHQVQPIVGAPDTNATRPATSD